MDPNHYLLTFRPFDQLPSPVKEKYLGQDRKTEQNKKGPFRHLELGLFLFLFFRLF
jgi:hypothetical protein